MFKTLVPALKGCQKEKQFGGISHDCRYLICGKIMGVVV